MRTSTRRRGTPRGVGQRDNGGRRVRRSVLATLASMGVALMAVAAFAVPHVRSTGAEAARGQLPELPPAWELHPELFDERGCERRPPDEGGGVICGPETPPGVSAGAEAPEHAWQRLRGFVGPGYVDRPGVGDVVLLNDSVTVSGAGRWRAWGLVRNETSGPAGAVVGASLFDPRGTPLGEVTAAVPVDPLRPGEPGPFALESDVPASRVARVEWTIETRASGPGSERDLEILQHWVLPYGDRDRYELEYSDPAGPPPYPYVLGGDVRNLEDAPVAQPTVVAAWVDRNGAVAWVEEARAGRVPFNASRAATWADRVDPGVPSPYYLVVDEAGIAPLLTDPTRPLVPMLWAVSAEATR